GAEQRCPAVDASKETGIVKLIVSSGVRCVRTSLARNVKLAGAEELPPFAVGADRSLHQNRPLLLPGVGEFHDGDFLRRVVSRIVSLPRGHRDQTSEG